MPLPSLSADLFRVERLLREAASARQSGNLDQYREKLHEARDLLLSLSQRDTVFSDSAKKMLTILDLIDKDVNTSYSYLQGVAHSLAQTGLVSTPSHFYSDIKKSAPMILNDLSHLVHLLADSLSKYRSVGNSVYVHESAKIDDVSYACYGFEKARERMHEGGYFGFNMADVNAQACYVTPNGVEIQVGSTEGHRAHVEKRNGVGILEYYDVDDTPREVLKRAVESKIGASCTDDKSSKVLRCEVSKPIEYDFFVLGALVTAATSSDLRVERDFATYARFFKETDDIGQVAEFDSVYNKLVRGLDRIPVEAAFLSSFVVESEDFDDVYSVNLISHYSGD